MTTKTIRTYDLPAISPGNARQLKSVHFGPKNSKQKVYIQAGLHADEAPGYLVSTELIRLLEKADAKGEILQEILIVPAANPVGLAQWQNETVQGRFDRCDNVNFNRRYQDLTDEIKAKVDGQLTNNPYENVHLIRKTCKQILASKSPVAETDYLKNLLLTLSIDADIVLDLHCDFQALMHIYMGTPLWPGNADLAAQMGAGAILLAEDSGDTPFDEANSKIWWELATEFPDLPIPAACTAATVELRGILDTDPSQTLQDAQNLYSYLQRKDFVAGDPPELPQLLAAASPLEGVDYVTADKAGILSFVKEVGEIVKEGEIIATITDPVECADTCKKTTVCSKTSGALFARSVDRFSRPGKIIAKVAGQKILAGKGDYLLTA